MSRFTRSIRFAALSTLLAVALPAQGGPPPEVRAAVSAVEAMLESTGDGALTKFAADWLAPAYRATFAGDSLMKHLKGLRAALGGPIGAVQVERVPDGLHLVIEAGRPVTIALQLDAAAKLSRLELARRDEGSAGRSGKGSANPLGATTWESLADDLRRAEATGFSGVILARRAGREVVRTALGTADRASGRPMALNTVFCIGSTPIDFTVASILLLGQRGRLTLDDPITRWLPGVPEDKRALTIRHLMSGRSGLPDFHHVDGVDADRDLSWIDRATAERRILGQTLRFAPGADRAHSHSAFGLLAAIIERVSGRSYPEFVRAEILVPLGMTRTGFYGETLGLAKSEFATGYGQDAVGDPNIPPHWGPTSWLVMGSGGMVSTLEDLDRFFGAIQGGTFLAGEWGASMRGPRQVVGGSDRGFHLFQVTDAKGTELFFLTNANGPGSMVRPLTEAMRRLAAPR